jgi:hypothetical protein
VSLDAGDIRIGLGARDGEEGFGLEACVDGEGGVVVEPGGGADGGGDVSPPPRQEED